LPAINRALTAEINRLIRRGDLKRRALRSVPERDMVAVVYESKVDDEGLYCAPFEFEIPASRWESLCFYAASLRLQHFLASALTGIVIAGFTLLMAEPLEVAGIYGALIAIVVLFLMAHGSLKLNRKPRSGSDT
jgi:hypothetical protein